MGSKGRRSFSDEGLSPKHFLAELEHFFLLGYPPSPLAMVSKEEGAQSTDSGTAAEGKCREQLCFGGASFSKVANSKVNVPSK